MLILYRLLAALVSPLALWRLHRPARSVAGFRGRWRERLGSLPPCRSDSIWIHAASVGEVNAAQALIRQLKRDHPDRAVLVSTFTVTGAQRVSELFGDSVEHRFAPLDNWFSTRRWLQAARPARMIMIETEIWPELYLQANKFGLSPILVNARLTERSLHRMQRFDGLYRPAMKAIGSAICQSEQDARRFRALGLSSDRTPVAGNLKFDIPLAEDLGARANALRQRWGARPVWVAGSTREGEESTILAAHKKLMKDRPEALLVLAPRHPQRSAEVAALIKQSGLKVAALDDEVDTGTSVVLIDRLGQLMPCYAAAMATFVGGSLVPIGGHNLLEPASLGKAVIAGPHLHEQAEPARALEQAGGLLKVADADELARSVARLWGNPEYALRIGRAALGVVEAGRGSLRRTLRLLSAATG
jgi:3-deoxy-D-manno-octulosonic-acid transferase